MIERLKRSKYPMPLSGKRLWLSLLIGQAHPRALVLRLFTNDIQPSADDTLAKYREMVGGGYEPLLLTAKDWIVGHDRAVYKAKIEFGGASDEQVYGYLLAHGNELVQAIRFKDGPHSPRVKGDSFEIEVMLAIL